MKYTVAYFAVLFFALSTLTVYADSLSVAGGAKLTASTLELNENTVIAKGNASLSTREASIKANTIRLSLEKGKGGKLGLSKALATGRVVINASQVDAATKARRTVDATAENASMAQDADTVLLTGKVFVKVSDPQFAEPATIAGERVVVYLKERKIQVEGGSNKSAEINVTPREGE